MARTPEHSSRLELAKEFYSRYQSRIVKGLATYGEFNPETDKRCLAVEAQEEILDVGSYMDMAEQKHPELRSPIQKIRAKAILLYGELKKLETLEKERTK